MLLARRGLATTGIDFSETAIELARRNVADSGLAIALVVGDALDLAAFGDATFDVLTDNHVLHCIVDDGDRARFLRSARRVLRAGGVFFTETMSREGDWSAERCSCDPVTGVARNRTRIWASEDRLDRELAAAGFDVFHRGRGTNDPGTGASLIRWGRVE
jgi:ubiquinone/menaquinone biosynthesis C-methylase UbiE